MNADTGTNAAIVSRGHAYNLRSRHAEAQAMSKIEALADRVERLLLRHDELQRTNALLEQQLGTVTHERDNLRSRLNAARSRIDALLERLPIEAAPDNNAVTEPDSTGSKA
jgi:cell division protein ZapB